MFPARKIDNYSANRPYTNLSDAQPFEVVDRGLSGIYRFSWDSCPLTLGKLIEAML